MNNKEIFDALEAFDNGKKLLIKEPIKGKVTDYSVENKKSLLEILSCGYVVKVKPDKATLYCCLDEVGNMTHVNPNKIDYHTHKLTYDLTNELIPIGDSIKLDTL